MAEPKRKPLTPEQRYMITETADTFRRVGADWIADYFEAELAKDEEGDRG